ncbi:MAG: low specificity L-threonine aldolase [Clostridia bacterium]|nr:low specificity L-threonine aldolase [Clostridia bacterium]
MLPFSCDYMQGAHPKILERFVETNLVPQPGYGEDEYCASAKEKIRAACGCPEAQIFFLNGGTQSNKVVIDSLCRSYEGVICALTGHINAHESGAIEATGRKCLALPQKEGKLEAQTVRKYLTAFYADGTCEHMVFPGMVYISHPTEYGTLYSKAELTALSEVCKEYDIPLFMDGARLGYGLMSRQTDVTLEDVARLCDVFYIGGTKVGALCGEAVVFTKNNMPPHFLTLVKRQGALSAKGRLLGVQFDTLFTDNLYFDISRHAIDMAEKLKEIFAAKGYKFFMDSHTNQQFVVLENEKLEILQKQAYCSIWEPWDEHHTVVRFCTSWATTPQDIEALDALI